LWNPNNLVTAATAALDHLLIAVVAGAGLKANASSSTAEQPAKCSCLERLAAVKE
jgi:hypothetical protein